MTHKNRSLSVNEAAALDVINQFPGLTPLEIVKHLDSSHMSPSSISACTSRLVFLKKVNRVKVPGSPTFRYYPKDAALPKGYVMWNNGLNKVNRSKSNGEQVTDGHKIDARTRDLFNRTEDARVEQKLQPIDSLSIRRDDVLITIPVGDKESLTVNIEQARKIWAQLDAIFGGK